MLTVHRIGADAAQRRTRVGELLEMVGLRPSVPSGTPHQVSGGKRQRVGIARALAVEPSVLVLDEPVSALDLSVRAEVMNLLARLRAELGLSYVFISHDLGMVRHISDRIAVMYLGRVMEVGGWREVSDAPLHPYTHSLRDAVPVADPEVEAARQIVPLDGEVPDAAYPPVAGRSTPGARTPSLGALRMWPRCGWSTRATDRPAISVSSCTSVGQTATVGPLPSCPSSRGSPAVGVVQVPSRCGGVAGIRVG